MKFTRKWAWENTWLVWTVFALVLLPPAIAYLTVPMLAGVYHSSSWGIILAVMAFGAGWGIAQVLFGLALESIGIALTFSIVLGLSAAMGSLIPLIQLHRDKLFTHAGIQVLVGVMLVVFGVAICAIAGRMRESAHVQRGTSNQNFAKGLAIAITSGVCASMMNFGVAFGGPIIHAALDTGTKSYWSINSIWFPLMIAGAFPNALYCIYLLRKNGTAKNFSLAGTSTYWLLAFVMASFWFGSTLLYGVASVRLGELGAVLGWPLFMSLIVILASLLGVITGEWKNTGTTPLRIQFTGVAVLVVAVIVLSRASL